MNLFGRHESKRTTILRPSVTSPRSRAALTRALALDEFNRLSSSSIASIQGSPTFESRIRVASEGETVMSDRRFERGLSIFCRG